MARVSHVPDKTAKTLRHAIVTQARKQSEIHTDESLTYYWLAREFEKHNSVNHSKDEDYKGRRWRAVRRSVLCYPEARYLWDVPQRQRGSLAALLRRVRVSLE